MKITVMSSEIRDVNSVNDVINRAKDVVDKSRKVSNVHTYISAGHVTIDVFYSDGSSNMYHLNMQCASMTDPKNKRALKSALLTS